MKHISRLSIAPVRNLTLLLFVLSLSVIGCRKNSNPGHTFPGNYTGVYEYFTNGVWYHHEVTAISFTFNDSTFIAHNIVRGLPNSATGKYHIINDSTVNFSAVTRDSSLIGIIANGNYPYHYKQDSLIIGNYPLPFFARQYRLKKN